MFWAIKMIVCGPMIFPIYPCSLQSPPPFSPISIVNQYNDGYLIGMKNVPTHLAGDWLLMMVGNKVRSIELVHIQHRPLADCFKLQPLSTHNSCVSQIVLWNLLLILEHFLTCIKKIQSTPMKWKDEVGVEEGV